MKRHLHETSPERKVVFAEIMRQLGGTDGANQCERLLQGLQRCGHVTTYEALNFLDIYRPPSRKFDLVQAGHKIITSRRVIETMSGVRQIGVYALAKGAA